MIKYLHLKQVMFICLSVLITSQTVFANEDTDQASEKISVQHASNQDKNEEDSVKSTFDTVTDVVLSPAHYAILLGGKLLPHHTSKDDSSSADPVSDGDNITHMIACPLFFRKLPDITCLMALLSGLLVVKLLRCCVWTRQTPAQC